jgi:hypothetical protein
MTSDQVYESFVQATGFRESVPNNQPNLVSSPAREEFRAKFADAAASPIEIETTILQALSLMNGAYVASATDLEQSEFLAAVAESPIFDHAGRVETLFLAVFSRLPTSDELVLFTSQSTDDADRKKELAEVLWTLLNSAEFLLNH